jgi:hypothetical protein
MLIPLIKKYKLMYAYQVRIQDRQMTIYPRKVPKYLLHIFLEVLLEYAISFINYKALQKENEVCSTDKLRGRGS